METMDLTDEDVQLHSRNDYETIEDVEETDSSDEDDDLKDQDIEEVVEEVEAPSTGKTFKDSEEMFAYYKTYGKQKGFPVNRRTSKKGKNGVLQYVIFTCGFSGKTRSKSSNALKPHPNNKTGCTARIGGCLGKDGRWRINTVDLEHNHSVSPSKSRLFRCYRELSSHVKRRLEVNDKACIRMNKSFTSFVAEAGGHDNISFLEKDCRNYIEKVRQLQLGEGDAIALQKYFVKMQAQNSDFFFSMDLDDQGRLKNVFWADSRSRAARREFGEVITFDTTYLINKYDMPFAPFVGVNHHGQSVLLGCGLISSETTETFTWLFRTWLECMGGSPPNGIITDQDKAMKRAIEIVFPNSQHRWYLWHIMKKVPEKIGSYKFYDSISFSLKQLVYDSQYPSEFEERWLIMIEKYGLHKNEWLGGLFGERRRWVPCFVKNNFWAGMSTTQRSESINAFFDGYVNSKTSLKQFVEKYGVALADKVEKEIQEDFRSKFKQIPYATTYTEMEKQAQEVYTMAKFKEFMEELTGKMYCEFISFKEDYPVAEYDIREDVMIGDGKKRMVFKVIFDRDACEVNCSCKRFEFKGILCRHALGVLIRNDVLKIPEKYILSRWRKDLKRCHSKIKLSCDGWSTTDEQRRYDKLCIQFAELANIAADSEENYETLMGWIKNAIEEFPKNSQLPHLDVGTTVTEGQYVLDPVVTRKKGRPPSKRKESKIKRRRNNKKSNSSIQKDDKFQSSQPEVIETRKETDQIPNQGQINTQGGDTLRRQCQTIDLCGTSQISSIEQVSSSNTQINRLPDVNLTQATKHFLSEDPARECVNTQSQYLQALQYQLFVGRGNTYGIPYASFGGSSMSPRNVNPFLTQGSGLFRESHDNMSLMYNSGITNYGTDSLFNSQVMSESQDGMIHPPSYSGPRTS